MTPLYTVFALGLVVAQLALPRRLAFLPLLIAVFHLPNISAVSIGGFDFSICRLVITLGVIRALSSGQAGRLERSPLDLLVVLWSVIALLSTLAHERGAVNPLSLRLGMIYNFAGAYFYARFFLFNEESIRAFAKSLIVVLIPLALLMGVEKRTASNPYARLGGISEASNVRDGKVRAGGPFAHAILAGTAGASLFPLALIFWRQRRSWAIAGAAACVLITYSSGSSGPIMTLLAALAAVGLWHWRARLREIRTGVILALIGLHIIMKAPVWYLIARIDITGGSTGYHRAALIDGALAHLGEWWLAGTDVTRHWMATGVSWSEDHTDITNHYLKMGVIGGLPLMFAFIAILWKAFQLLGRRMAKLRNESDPGELVCWLLGAMLFAHAVTFISVSYFDQTGVFVCFIIGLVPGLCAHDRAANREGQLNTNEGKEAGSQTANEAVGVRLAAGRA